MSDKKSGYQLRAELLTLARDIVETNIHFTTKRFETIVNQDTLFDDKRKATRYTIKSKPNT